MVWLWAGFVAFILAMLALDLGVLNRRAHVIGVREALGWTALWVVLALTFGAAVYFMYEHHWLGVGLHAGADVGGKEASLNYLAGYVIEKSLSLDNIFVIALIFAYFGVPDAYQHRVLFWGILGALVLRGVMIAAGVALIRQFEWITYVFGAFLIATAVKMLITRHDEIHPDRNPLVRLARKLYPVHYEFVGQKFFTRINGRKAITPLFLVLLLVESSDVLFAVDSIPAIFAITRDPFLVFTSNVFAILGLRSLYFVLAGIIQKFRYLKPSLMLVLGFVGVKMILEHHYPISTPVSLGVIGVILLIGIVASLVPARRQLGGPNPGASPSTGVMGMLTWKRARRIVVAVVGTTVVLVGLALVVLPGPAFVVIPLGLAILATEFVWARRLLRRVRRYASDVGHGLTGSSSRASTESTGDDTTQETPGSPERPRISDQPAAGSKP